jgi:hypothetical protein
MKLNIGNVTQALILPANRSPDEFHDLPCEWLGTRTLLQWNERRVYHLYS